jgi:hypothetical protein
MQDYEIAREELSATIAAMDIDRKAQFIPFSQSRNAHEKQASLNWKIDLVRKGSVIMPGIDYMQGQAYCPAYKAQCCGKAERYVKPRAIALECATGHKAIACPTQGVRSSSKPIAPPSVVDVVQCLLMDSDVLNYRGFDDWADCLGYDTDSRKAEAIYRACLDTALQLRAIFGEPELSRLQEIANRF